MKIEMPSKKGLILHTKNKYCNDDFEIIPTFDMSESDIVVKVNELPTTNIDKSKIYLVNENVVGIPQNYIAYVYDNGWVSVAKIQEDYNLLDEQYKLLFKDYQILETNNTNLQNSYNNLQVENTTLQNNNSILQNENTTLQNDKVVLQNQNTILNTQNNELQSSVNNLTNENTTLQTTVDNLTVENTTLQTTINNLENDNASLTTQNERLERNYNSLNLNYQTLSTNYSNLKENYNVALNEKEKFAVQKDAFLGYIQGTKTELTAKDLDGLVNVRSYAFRSSALTSIIFPNTVKTLAQNALRDTSSLETVFLPNSITSISSYAFYALKKLKNVTFEENSVLKSIPNYGFQVCSSLPKLTLPNSITTIGAYAFSGCSALTFFEMGKNIKSISDNAFTSCTALKTLIIKTVTPPSIYATSFKNVTFDAIYVPDISVNEYKAKTNWSALGDFIFPLSSYIPSEV